MLGKQLGTFLFSLLKVIIRGLEMGRQGRDDASEELRHVMLLWLWLSKSMKLAMLLKKFLLEKLRMKLR